MNCRICGTEFIPKTKVHKYCSTACREKNRRATPLRKENKKRYNRKYEESDRGKFVTAQWREQNKDQLKEYYRRHSLQLKYGITIEQYDELLAAQKGGCAICGKTPEQEGRNLAVDHDHKTGEIFGILCFFCNHKVIGRQRDVEKYLKAAKYLEQGTGWFVPPKKKRRRKKKRK